MGDEFLHKSLLDQVLWWEAEKYINTRHGLLPEKWINSARCFRLSHAVRDWLLRTGASLALTGRVNWYDPMSHIEQAVGAFLRHVTDQADYDRGRTLFQTLVLPLYQKYDPARAAIYRDWHHARF